MVYWFLFLWQINRRGLFNAKAILVEHQHWYYLTLIWEVHAFPQCINTKMNVIARLGFELAYFEAPVQYISHEDSLSAPGLRNEKCAGIRVPTHH